MLKTTKQQRIQSIGDCVRLVAPEPEVLKAIGEESVRNGTSAIPSRQIDKIIRKARTRKAKR